VQPPVKPEAKYTAAGKYNWRVKTPPTKLPDITIAISGCPNNCAQSAVADIGLTGMLRKINDKPVEHFKITTGGGRGRTPVLGKDVGVFTTDDSLTAIKDILNNI